MAAEHTKGGEKRRRKYQRKSQQTSLSDLAFTYRKLQAISPVAALPFAEAQSSTRSGVPHNPFEGVDAGRQSSESVDEFLSRLPPTDPASASIGPWIWIANLQSDRKGRNKDDSDRDASAEFGSRCQDLLRKYERQEEKIQQDMQGKAQGSITRKLTPLRTKLKDDLLKVAKEEKCVCGKV